MCNLPNTDKDNKKHAEQDVASNKILVLLTLSFCAAFVLMFIYRGLNALATTVLTMNIVRYSIFAGLAALALSVVWYMRNRSRKVDESFKVFTSYNCIKGAVVAILAMCAVDRFGTGAIKVLYAVIPIYVALYFVKHVYARPLLLLAYYSVGAAIAFYVYNKVFDYVNMKPYVIPIVIISVILCGICIAMVYYIKKNGGVLKASAKDIRVFPKDTNYLLMLCAPIVSVVFLLGYFVLGTPAMRYGLFATACYAFICFIYYTIMQMSK